MSQVRAATAPPPAELFWRAWIAFGVVVLVVDSLDVQAALRDGGHGVWTSPWEPVIWEYTSGACQIALYPMVWRLACLVYPGDGRPLRVAPVHALGSVVFSLVHIGGFILLRDAIYAMAGARYHFDGLAGVLYEYPRDLVAYGLAAGGLWGLGWLMNSRAGPPPAPVAMVRGEPVTFDIRDGARVLRVPLSEIAAVSSAGNYVEFSLVDCRKPLMRATLGAIEQQFAAKGFVRIHRSWLVNAARVEAIEPAGSGDFTVTLAGGVKAPLSRRFREALDALRA